MSDEPAPGPESRLLSADEKRAPKLVPWRPDAKETIAGISIAAVAVIFAAWLVWTFILRKDEIGWREDGIIVEVRLYLERPRPEVTSVAERRESYPWAFPPNDIFTGACNDPRFRIDGMPERGRIYREGEELAITIAHDTPGCRQMYVEFEGLFEVGSPGFNHFCDALEQEAREAVCDESIPSSFWSAPLSFSETTGKLTLTAVPGTSPAADPSSPPASVTTSPDSIEGFKLCSITISVNDGVKNGSRSSQRVHVDCLTASDF